MKEEQLFIVLSCMLLCQDYECEYCALLCGFLCFIFVVHMVALTPNENNTTPGPDQNQEGSLNGCQDATFKCPYCGKCTMEQFFSDEGCFKQAKTDQEKKKILFPYLDISNLNEVDRIDFEDRLLFETREIKLHFTRFLLAVIQLLEDLQIPLEKIKVFILSLEAFTDDLGVKVLDEVDAQKVEAAKNISEIFIALRKYISFFNHRILGNIIDQYGKAGDNSLLDEYLEKFHRFCQRNVFEVPANLFPSISRFTAKVFALKCTGVTSMNGVECVKGRYCKNFRFATCSFATLFYQGRLC